MKKYPLNEVEQLELLTVKEENKRIPAKRVDIVSLRMVKEASMLYQNRRIRSPKDSAELFREYLGEVDREHFVVMCLDTKNQPTNISTVHIGTLNASLVHPREVMKTAILSNSASIVCCHPHPSGDPAPSQEDIDVTKRLADAGKILGIEVLDHLVIGGASFLSMRELGYL